MPEILVKNKENHEEKPEKPHKRAKGFLNKVVIRRLPPNLNEAMFIESISPLPDIFEIYFISADWTLGAEATSRAYIEFKHEEDVSQVRKSENKEILISILNISRFSYSKTNLMATCSLTASVAQNTRPLSSMPLSKGSPNLELGKRIKTLERLKVSSISSTSWIK